MLRVLVCMYWKSNLNFKRPHTQQTQPEGFGCVNWTVNSGEYTAGHRFTIGPPVTEAARDESKTHRQWNFVLISLWILIDSLARSLSQQHTRARAHVHDTELDNEDTNCLCLIRIETAQVADDRWKTTKVALCGCLCWYWTKSKFRLKNFSLNKSPKTHSHRESSTETRDSKQFDFASYKTHEPNVKSTYIIVIIAHFPSDSITTTRKCGGRRGNGWAQQTDSLACSPQSNYHKRVKELRKFMQTLTQ